MLTTPFREKIRFQVYGLLKCTAHDRANHLDAPQDNADEQSHENQYSPAATEPVWSQEYPCRPVWLRNGGTRGDLVFTGWSRSHLVKLARAHMLRHGQSLLLNGLVPRSRTERDESQQCSVPPIFALQRRERGAAARNPALSACCCERWCGGRLRAGR